MEIDTNIVINDQHALKWAVIGWLAEPGTHILWSTHSHTENRAVFHEVEDALFHPAVNLPFARITRANGGQEIRLENGSRVVFRPRISLSVKGFAVDKLIVDEAAEITNEQLGALLPTVLASNGDVVYSL